VAAALPLFLGASISNLANPALKITGIAIMVIPAMLGLIGSAGLISRIGAGLPAPADAQHVATFDRCGVGDASHRHVGRKRGGG
jgi:hypothetical protein